MVLVAVAGCTSGDGGSVGGHLPGGSTDLSNSISAVVMTSDGAGGSASSAQIMLASTDGLCGDAGAMPPIDRKGQRFVTIGLRDVSGASSTAPTAPGSYTIYPNTGSEPPKSASLDAGGFDNTCQLVDADMASAQSGTVTLTTVSGGVFSGSFDVILNTGDHLTGSFTPTACPALQTAAASTDPHSCE